MLKTLAVFQAIFNWIFCLTPILLIIQNLRSNKYGIKPSPMLALFFVMNFMSFFLYLIYRMTVFDSVSDLLACFAGFLLSAYSTLQCWTLSTSNPTEQVAPVQEVTASLHEQDVNNNISMNDVERQSLSQPQKIPSNKTLSSDTLVFNLDGDNSVRNNSVRKYGFSHVLHGPVMATLLALSPAPTNAMPITMNGSIDSKISAESLTLTLAILNVVVIYSSKFAQILLLRKIDHTRLGAMRTFYCIQALIVGVYTVMTILTTSMPQFIYIFKWRWAYACDILLDCAIIVMSFNWNRFKNNDNLARELKNRLSNFRDSQNWDASITQYGTVTYDDDGTK